jgi:DEAD/DEAH box helicase domain-containing protein
MVAHDDPLEQFLVRQPELLLDATHESVAINPENPQILGRQLVCAAYERPIAPSEMHLFGESAMSVAESLDRSGELQFQSGLFYYPRYEPPALGVNIRGSGSDQVRLLVDGHELGTMERWRAMTNAHKGAVYLHRGATYLVEELDLDRSEATVKPATVDYYTQAISRSILNPGPPVRAFAMPDSDASLCGVTVTDIVHEFRRKTLDGDTVLSIEPLDLPPITYDTVCVRFDLPAIAEDPGFEEAIGGVHGMEHALLAVAPLLSGCDRGDIGNAWYSVFPDTLRPAIFVFDRTPGGVGLCEKLFDSLGGWVKAAVQLLATCPCEQGCPACLMNPRCESGNEALSKTRAIQLLSRLA